MCISNIQRLNFIVHAPCRMKIKGFYSSMSPNYDAGTDFVIRCVPVICLAWMWHYQNPTQNPISTCCGDPEGKLSFPPSESDTLLCLSSLSLHQWVVVSRTHWKFYKIPAGFHIVIRCICASYTKSGKVNKRMLGIFKQEKQNDSCPSKHKDLVSFCLTPRGS